MHFPVIVPPLLAATMCLVCAIAGGSHPQEFFQEWQPVTLYNALQLFLCASVAGAIAKTVAARRAPAVRQPTLAGPALVLAWRSHGVAPTDRSGR